MLRVMMVLYAANLLPLARASVVKRNSPSGSCRVPYKPEQTLFEFQQQISTRVNAAIPPNDQSSIRLIGHAMIHVTRPCTATLAITDPKVVMPMAGNEQGISEPISSPEIVLLQNQLVKYQTLFHFNREGVVQIMSHPKEPVHITNIKRGILSMLSFN